MLCNPASVQGIKKQQRSEFCLFAINRTNNIKTQYQIDVDFYLNFNIPGTLETELRRRAYETEIRTFAETTCASSH